MTADHAFRTLSRCAAALLAGGISAAAQDDPPATPLPDDAPAAMAAIDQADLRRHATHLAGDELRGRYTGTPGQYAAARYIADRLAELGCEPLGDVEEAGERTFLQAWPLHETALDTEVSALRFGDVEITQHFGVVPGERIADLAVRGRLVDCGRGAPDERPEEFAADEIAFVLLRTRSPRARNVNLQFMFGLQYFGKAASIGRKLYDAGAQAVVFGTLHDDSGLGEMLNYAGLVPGKPLLRYGDDAGMAEMVAQLKAAGPLVFLPRAGTEQALAILGRAVDDGGELVEVDAPEAAAAAVRLRIVEDAGARAVNVCGVLRGADPELADEALVFSAHMDHVGTRMDGDVFNGADDNASGSAALLEVAEAFARGERPRRSLVFLAVSGEELGLWGSQHFVAQPSWPAEDIIANVNIDMIGRFAELSGEGEIALTPSHSHPKYSSIARTAARYARPVGLHLTIGDEFYTRSDHYNFAERGIPVVFFTDGEHADYHQVTDTADKLEYGKIEQVARLAYWTGLTVANDAARPREIGRQPDWLPGDGDGDGDSDDDDDGDGR